MINQHLSYSLSKIKSKDYKFYLFHYVNFCLFHLQNWLFSWKKNLVFMVYRHIMQIQTRMVGPLLATYLHIRPLLTMQTTAKEKNILNTYAH